MKLVAAGKIGGYVVRLHGPDAIGQQVRVNGKIVYFDYCRHTGPLVTTPRGEPMKRQPVREEDPFWPAFRAWLEKWELEQVDG